MAGRVDAKLHRLDPLKGALMRDARQARTTLPPPILLFTAVAALAGAAVACATNAQATEITLPPIVATIFLPTASAGTVGSSTDGANFSAGSVANPARAFPAQNVYRGTMGSATAGFGSAFMPAVTPPPPFTRTLAIARAGNGQSAAVASFAQAGGQIKFAAAGKVGDLTIKIDPFLFTSGSATATMSFGATLDGTTLFSAGATLDDGSLSTSGMLSNGDFSLTGSLGSETATLTTTVFEVPIEISTSQVGQELAFEFDQMFDANSSNGGVAMAQIAEPTGLSAMAAGLIGLLGLSRKPRIRARPVSESG
jgi:hypothetical protein